MTKEPLNFEQLAEVVWEHQQMIRDLQRQIEYILKHPCHCRYKSGSDSNLNDFMN